jgi:hypothetical protein
VKYVYESMEPVGDEYTQKTYTEAARVENQIKAGIASSKGVIKEVAFEYQGSVPLNTHIKVHSDLDILVVQDRFYYGVPFVAPRIDYLGKPFEELKELRSNIFDRLTSSFPAAAVRNKKPKCIEISGGSLKRKFDILICSRFNTKEYVDTRAHNHKAISLYNLDSNNCQEDHPFSHMYEVDKKDTNISVRGNLRRIVRLLKSIKMDADVEVNLSSFMITSIMFHMDNNKFNVGNDKLSELLVNTSLHLNEVITDEALRKSLRSPNKKEPLFPDSDNSVLSEVKKLKSALDIVIEDLADDFKDMSSKVNIRALDRVILNESYADLGSKYKILNTAQFSYF